VKRAIKLMPQLCALVTIQLNGGAGQPPIGPVSDRYHRPQIARQFGDGRRRRLGFELPSGFQKQLRLFENPPPDGSRSFPPCGVQLPGFTAAEPMRRQRFGQALAVLGTGASHRH